MKEEQDYVRDIAEIRSMMERSSKFLSLSGWAGIMAGIYALAGAFAFWRMTESGGSYLVGADDYDVSVRGAYNIDIIIIGAIVLVLAIGTGIFFSAKKARKRNEKLWNKSARQLLMSMATPLVTGGLVILVLMSKGFIHVAPTCSLLFYGLALYNAGMFTYKEVKTLGYIQIVLGMLSLYFVEYGVLLWAIGFGIMHIVYGIYIHYKYER